MITLQGADHFKVLDFYIRKLLIKKALKKSDFFPPNCQITKLSMSGCLTAYLGTLNVLPHLSATYALTIGTTVA